MTAPHTSPLEALRTRRGDKLHIALRHKQRNTIVAMGTFPINCPPAAIENWIKTKAEPAVV